MIKYFFLINIFLHFISCREVLKKADHNKNDLPSQEEFYVLRNITELEEKSSNKSVHNIITLLYDSTIAVSEVNENEIFFLYINDSLDKIHVRASVFNKRETAFIFSENENLIKGITYYKGYSVFICGDNTFAKFYNAKSTTKKISFFRREYFEKNRENLKEIMDGTHFEPIVWIFEIKDNKCILIDKDMLPLFP